MRFYKEFTKRGNFYNSSSRYVGDACDCYRRVCCSQPDVMENRYFFTPPYSPYLGSVHAATYLQWFGV